MLSRFLCRFCWKSRYSQVLYWKQEKWDMVAEMFGKVLELEPGHEGAKRYLPQALARIKRH